MKILSKISIAAMLAGGLGFAGEANVTQPPASALEWNSAGVGLWSKARYRDAEAAFRRAMELWPQDSAGNAQGAADTAANLGSVLTLTGKYEEAGQLLSKALAQAEEASGGSSVQAARIQGSLAVLFRMKGDLGKAESHALRAREIFEQSPEATDVDRYRSRQVLASVWVEQRRFPDAETLLESIAEGAGGTLSANAYNALMSAALSQRDYERAEGYGVKALGSARKSLPASHPAMAAILNNFGQVCRFQRRYIDAEKHYREAIAMWEDTLGSAHPDLARGLTNLAAFYHEREREAGAESLYRRALGILEPALGGNAVPVLLARADLSDVLRGERRYTEAAKLSRATLPVLEEKLGAADERVARAQRNYARLLDEMNGAYQAAGIDIRARSQAPAMK